MATGLRQGAFKKERGQSARWIGQNLRKHADKAVRAPPAKFLNSPWSRWSLRNVRLGLRARFG